MKKRVLSGMRPTGRLHVGHLEGALRNWCKLQDEYECFYFVADWHALTTHYKDPSGIVDATYEMVADWLAVGIDPEKAVLFRQSDVVEHAELALVLSMITPLGWLERVPTYKEMRAQEAGDLSTYGFLGYPVLQTADIVIYRAHFVPVGEDQVPHIELSREIVRRFNSLYGDTFPEPQPLLTRAPRIVGTDGRKMSKSYDNAIFLGDTPEEIKRKVMPMFTDPQRLRRTDPGNPDVCGVYYLHRIYSDPETVETVDRECRRAGIGCVDCKKMLLPALTAKLAPIRERREALIERKDRIEDILRAGAEKARSIARETMQEVRRRIGLSRD